MNAENPHVIPGVPVILDPINDARIERLVTESRLPEHMHEGVIAYFRYGRRCGDFLRAVICNDARDAIRRADDENRAALGEWFAWMVSHAPMIAWGDVEAYDGWLQKGREAREAAKAQAQP